MTREHMATLKLAAASVAAFLAMATALALFMVRVNPPFL